MVLASYTRYAFGDHTRRFLFVFEILLRTAQYIGFLIGVWAAVSTPLWLAFLCAIFTAILHVLANECYALRNYVPLAASLDAKRD